MFTIMFVMRTINLKPTKSISNIKIREFLFIHSMTCWNLGGAAAKRILEPSSGGIGIRLKTPNNTFMYTTRPPIT